MYMRNLPTEQKQISDKPWRQALLAIFCLLFIALITVFQLIINFEWNRGYLCHKYILNMVLFFGYGFEAHNTTFKEV